MTAEKDRLEHKGDGSKAQPCPQGRTDYEACFAPFRYCPVKGCNRAETTEPEPAATGAEREATRQDRDPGYVPLDRTSATGAPRGPLAVCTRCGAVVEGDVTGQNRHDIWHRNLDDRIDKASKRGRDPRLGRIR